MHTKYCAHIRAQAQALVRMARVHADQAVALELETIALSLLKSIHDLEVALQHSGQKDEPFRA